MATSNFPFVNTSKYYTFELEDPDLFDCEIDGMAYAAESLGFDAIPREWIGRSSFVFAEKDVDLLFAGYGMATARVRAVVHGGYYAGACFDWTVEIIDGYGAVYGLDELELPAEDAICADFGPGLAKIHAKRTAAAWRAQIKAETDALESFFARCATGQLVRVGTFSNGAAVYVSAAV